MPTLPEPSLSPVFVPDTKVWLDVCAWKVAAGFPSPAADHTRKRIDLNEHLIRNKEATFIFRVKGDSMNGIGIYESDELLVDRSIEAKHPDGHFKFPHPWPPQIPPGSAFRL